MVLRLELATKLTKSAVYLKNSTYLKSSVDCIQKPSSKYIKLQVHLQHFTSKERKIGKPFPLFLKNKSEECNLQ